MSKKVLLINNVAPRPVIGELLEKAGYGVDTVSGTKAGLQHLDSRDYDVIIALEHPAAESWRLCHSIRDITSTPLIIICPNANTETSVRTINAGADYFIRKPFGPLELVARVNSLLQRVPINQPLNAV